MYFIRVNYAVNLLFMSVFWRRYNFFEGAIIVTSCNPGYVKLCNVQDSRDANPSRRQILYHVVPRQFKFEFSMNLNLLNATVISIILSVIFPNVLN